MKQNTRLNRTDWLEAAILTLVDEGIEGVRVESLARNLNVTKGSFYWHFEDRPDLLRAMLDYWAEQFTIAVTKIMANLPESSLCERLEAMESILDGIGGQEIEWAIHAWSHKDPRVLEVLTEIEAKRLAFVKSLFLDGGFAEAEAEVRGRLYVAYRTCLLLTTAFNAGERDGALTRIRIKLLCSKD